MTRQGGLLALLAFAALAVAGVLLRPLTPIDETRYLAVAWEMWQSGDYLVPTRNFALYTDKPPMLFWAINLVWAVTGVSEIAARLVGPAFALLTMGLTGVLARRLWPEDPQVGWRAIVALAGMIVFAILGGLTMFDALLGAAVVSGMLALVAAAETGRDRWWVALGAALAAGVLAKGPVVLLHLLPAALALGVWCRPGDGRRAPGLARTMRGLAISVGTALALIAPWLVPAIITGGQDYRDAILWTQSAGRITHSFAHARPWWFFLALMPFVLFPWIWVPGLWRAAWRTGWSEPGIRLAVIWFGAALILFSLISGKQTHYLIPELPAAALVVARLSRGLEGVRLWPATLPVGLAAVAGLLASAGVIPMGEVATLLHPVPMLVGWAFLLLSICGLALQRGGLAGGAILGIGTVLTLNLLIGLTDTRQIYDTHGIARLVAPGAADGVAFTGGTYHAEFNFAGRLTQQVATPATEAELDAWLTAHPRGLLIAERDRGPTDWAPRETVLFRNSPYSVWHSADAPIEEARK